jgi:phage tail protein X
MASKIKALQGQRLDQVFFKNYSDKGLFNQFLLANHHLLKKTLLTTNDVVNLPDLTKVEEGNKIIRSPLL